MEDQQPGPGDLTTEASEPVTPQRRRGIFRRRTKPDVTERQADTVAEPVTPQPAEDKPKTPVGKARRTVTAPAAPEAEVAQPDAPEPEETASDDEVAEETQADPDETAEEPAPEVVMVPHRPAGKRLIATAAAASLLFVGASAFAGAMAQPYLSERALVETKLDIARTATSAITTLWTYTPDDMPSLADRASRYLGGGFAEEYRMYIDAIVEPNKQAQVTNTTEVMGAAVESVAPAGTPTEATAIVYTNSVATSPVTKNIPSLRYLSYRLTMQRDGADWLITRMSTVTSFDLTPQL